MQLTPRGVVKHDDCRSVRRRAWCSAASQTMLRPDGAHLFVGRKLAPRDFLVGGGKVGLFLGRQLNHRFIVTSELQEEARDGILCFRRQVHMLGLRVASPASRKNHPQLISTVVGQAWRRDATRFLKLFRIACQPPRCCATECVVSASKVSRIVTPSWLGTNSTGSTLSPKALPISLCSTILVQVPANSHGHEVGQTYIAPIDRTSITSIDDCGICRCG